jgi:membrane-associated protein
MFDLTALIQAVGYLGVFAMVFAESGILLGFFFPGDSLLFTAGLLCSSGIFNIFILIALTFIGAVTGDSTGYYLGKKFGPKIFNKEKSFLFHPEHVRRTQDFFSKYGSNTIFIARFIPVVRTFAPVMAGVGKMDYKKFISYNIAGGACWSVVLPLLGYYLGNSIPNIDRYILPIAFVIIVISFIPALLQLRRG